MILFIDSFLKETYENKESTLTVLQKRLEENRLVLEKKKKAKELLDDAHEMGEYSKEQWLDRKRKREKEISEVSDEIEQVEKILCTNPKISYDNLGGTKLLQKRKRRTSPFFLSIGYACCHWCTSIELNKIAFKGSVFKI